MVLDEDEQIVEATMYQPYGTMLPVEGIGTTSAMPVREKFTTKEFDEDGAARGQLEIDFTFDPSVNLTHTSGDPLKTNRIGIYFADEPYEPVFAIYDQASEKWEIKGKFSYTTNRVIDRIHFMLKDDAINFTLDDIDRDVEQGKILKISKHDITISNLTAGSGDELAPEYTTIEGFYMAGIGGYHFGRRYYDPEIGGWTSTDPAGEFFNAYAYTNNPILIIDPNGMMTWKGVLGTIGMNIVGLGSLYLTGGKFGGVGYWDDETGDVAFYGGGTVGGIGYGGDARVNYKSGDYGAFIGVGSFAPINGGYMQIGGNWNNNTFQMKGFVFVPSMKFLSPFNLYYSDAEGWGFSLDITKVALQSPNWHANRNSLNGNFENAPETFKEAANDPNWEIQPEYARSTHGGHIVVNGTGSNTGKQLVYDKDSGRLIRGKYEGTYDYCPPGVSKIGHTWYDVMPWVLWGD